MATTRSRSRQRSAEIKRFSLSLSIISRMASTWPCGRDFCVVNRSCGETRGSSRSTRRKVSILSGGQSERLATVRLRVFWPSRQAGRRRTAGGEGRGGTTSMYMGALDHNNYALSSINLINYMGAYWGSPDGTMHTFPTVYPRIQPLLLLELRVNAPVGAVNPQASLRGLSSFDQTHRVVVSASYELPWMKSRQGAFRPLSVAWWEADWEISGVATFAYV